MNPELSTSVAPESAAVASVSTSNTVVSTKSTAAPWNVAEAVALLAVAAVSVAAFSWSAIALHGLAVMAGINERLAWGAPVIVDGPIVQSAFALVALNRRERAGVEIPLGTRRFFWWQLALAELVSLVGNGVHAAKTDSLDLPALAAAAVAGAAPVAALAVTHALTALLEVPRPEIEAEIEVDTTATPIDTDVSPVDIGVDQQATPAVDPAESPAAEATPAAEEPSTESTAERDARIVAMRAEGASYRQIGEEVGLHHSYVARICKAAAESDDAGPADPEPKEAALTLVS